MLDSQKYTTKGLLFDFVQGEPLNISKILVQHSRTKNIDIRHHFIRELVENKTLVFEYIETEKQIADIFTKALDSVRFDSLRKSLGVRLM